MPSMIEPNTPETQEPQTPEPEEDDEDEGWTPSPETRMAAAHVAQLAVNSPDLDPAEAGRLLRIAAKLIDPQPTFWQTFARDLVDALPTFMPMVERIMAMYVDQQKGSVIDGCWGPPYGMEPRRPLRPGMTVTGDIYPEPWPTTGRVVNHPPSPSIDETLRGSTGLSQRQYERFKDRLRSAGWDEGEVMEITGHLFGLADEPAPFRVDRDGNVMVGPAVP